MKDNKKYVLLTGASGLVGRNVSEALARQGFAVIQCNRKALFILNEIVGDISAIEWSNNVFDSLKGKDVIACIHLAAQPTVWRSIKHPKMDLECNVTATLNVIEVMNALSIPKIIFASSEAVFGENLYPDEATELKPCNPYGISKAAAENYIRFYSEIYGYDYTIVRPSFVIGNGFDRNVIFDILESIHLRKQGVELSTSLASKFNFVDVSCVSNTIVNLLMTEKQYDQINIVGREDVSLSEIINLIETLTGQEIKVQDNSQNIRIACLRSRYMDIYDHYQVTLENSLKKLIHLV